MSLIFTWVFINDFQNRKWNYPNRKWNYFTHFQASEQKTSFSTSYPYEPRSLQLVFNTGIGIIQTGNRILSPNSVPLIKNVIYNIFSIPMKEFQIGFQNRKWNHFFHLQASDQKNFFCNIFSILPKVLKMAFQNRKGNYFFQFWASDKKLLSQHLFHIYQGHFTHKNSFRPTIFVDPSLDFMLG